MVSEYRDPDTVDMFGQPPAPEPAPIRLDVSHLSRVSQPSNYAASRRDTTGTPPVPPQTRMVEPSGHVGHHKKQAGQDTAGPAHEVGTLLAALANAGRDLGPDLERQLRETLAPLSRRVRAELVAVIDDAFEVAPDVEPARRQAHHLLGSPEALEAAQAVWPTYPEQPPPAGSVTPAASRVEPLVPWLAHIARHCELALEDERYVIRHLSQRSEAEAMQLAWRYVEVWAAAADAEPQAHRRANAGRRAANTMLRGTTP